VKPVSLEEIAGVTGGEIIRGGHRMVLKSVSTDTRKIKKGDLFFALAGEKYDAHNFLRQAAAAGAGGLVVERATGLPPGVPVIKVDGVLAALQALAAYHREKCAAAVIGITGSNGKTTTKDLVASVLEASMPVFKTPGNLNNEIGLPLTLLAMDDYCRAAVVEMAMRGPGEIDLLCRIARPDGAVITNIGETHLELLETVSNIAAAKGEILEHIAPDGFALLHDGSPYVRREARRCRGRVIFFGDGRTADLRAEYITPEGGGSRFSVVIDGTSRAFYLPVPGRHNVLNALAAIGVGLEMGLDVDDIAGGLAAVSLTGMRLEITAGAGIKIINDAYNANPASTAAALQVLTETAGSRRKVAVLGNMFELGARAKPGHREVGALAAGLGTDCLLTVGDLAAEIAAGALGAGMPGQRIFRCQDNAGALEILDQLLQEGDVVLVKGSRGMQMEQIVRYLQHQKVRD